MIIALKVDVTKLDKTAFFKGQKGTYADLTIFINDEPDQYGNDCSVKQDLGKERREEKLYVGNGKIVSGGKQSAPPPRQAPVNRNIPSNRQQAAQVDDDDDLDIPF